MAQSSCSSRRFLHYAALLLCLAAPGSTARAQEAPSFDTPAAHPVEGRTHTVADEPAPVERPIPDEQAARLPPAVLPPYNKAIFERPIAPADLRFLIQFAGTNSSELFRDKQFRHLMKSGVPDCMFHYGRDMPLSEALETVFENSRTPVRIRDGRFVTLSGGARLLGGQAFLWIDMQEGLILGAFFFRPSNGEPSPTLNVFGRQVREDTLEMSAMPPDFAMDAAVWAQTAGVPLIVTRYFINGRNRKVLLEHDEDYCAPVVDGMQVDPVLSCQQMIADSADVDLTAAYFLDATHNATNATAWMIGEDQRSFLLTRTRTCGGALGCQIRMTRERVRVIARRPGHG